LVLAGVLGFLTHVLVFRYLEQAPPLARTVASIGVLLILQAVVVLRFTSQAVPVAPVLDKRPVDVLGTSIASDQLVLAITVVAVAFALWALFRFTRFGLATRAAAEDRRGAVLIGLAPQRLAAANWTISALVAGAFGIFAATVNSSLDPVSITLLVIPALGAALVGRLSSFGFTVAAAFAIASAQTLLQFLSATRTWFPRMDGAPIPGLKEAVPLVVILIVLFLRGDRLPTRGALAAERLPAAPAPTSILRPAVVAGVVGVAAVMLLGPSWRLAAINSTVGVVLCLSVVVLTGFAGQVSLGQMTFAGVSGFTMSKLATGLGIGMPFAPLLGACVATLVGLVAAGPALRVRGTNLAVATLSAAATAETLVFKNRAISGGLDGTPVPSPELFGFRFGPSDAASFGDGKLPSPLFGFFVLAVALALGVCVAHLRRSSLGRTFLAVRGNERAAAAAGIDVTRAKLAAFAVASFIAGLGGALSAYRFGSVTAGTFGVLASVSLLAFAYLGGISTVAGAVVGGLLVAGGVAFTALESWFGVDRSFTNLIGGVGLVVTAIAHPEGLAGSARRLGSLRRRPILRRAQPLVASPLPVVVDDGVAS
jgi:branched-chain amino acid transport system permease protein